MSKKEDPVKPPVVESKTAEIDWGGGIGDGVPAEGGIIGNKRK
jgi:hypothetical protein